MCQHTIVLYFGPTENHLQTIDCSAGQIDIVQAVVRSPAPLDSHLPFSKLSAFPSSPPQKQGLCVFAQCLAGGQPCSCDLPLALGFPLLHICKCACLFARLISLSVCSCEPPEGRRDVFPFAPWGKTDKGSPLGPRMRCRVGQFLLRVLRTVENIRVPMNVV